MSLKKLRKEIESIDKDIVKLFESRMKIVSEVSKYKHENNIPILDSSREDEVIEKNKKYLEDKKLGNYLEDFYKGFMDISKDYQRDLIDEKKLDTDVKSGVSATTGLLCIIGNPVEHSKSPHMHNLSLNNLGLDYSYMAFNIKRGFIKEAVEAMKVLNVRGFNITMPYKEEIMEHLDEINENAKLIGAVNTVLNHDGRLIGYNTDGEGFVKSLDKRNVEYRDKKIVILGAGGGGKSIAVEFGLKGAGEIVIINRTFEKAEKLANTINENIKRGMAKCYKLDEDILKREIKDSSILVNTTSVGMDELEDKSIIENPDVFHSDLFVGDVIYHPAKTKLLSIAEQAGCEIMNGLDMLIYQGDIAFKLWTGFNMPEYTIKTMEKDFL